MNLKITNPNKFYNVNKNTSATNNYYYHKNDNNNDNNNKNNKKAVHVIALVC